MDKELKEKWIEALRSDKYMQGNGRLRRIVNGQDEWCCLGVLCDIVDNSKWNLNINKEYNWDLFFWYVPKNLVRDEKNKILVKMNDQERKIFKEIADWVEINL